MTSRAAMPEQSARFPAIESPFLYAAEEARTIYVITLLAACGPLGAAMVLFGWRSAVVAGLSVGACMLVERAYYRVMRTPALFGRSHAALTGVLLALTLPAYAPWYVPVLGAIVAVIVGKAVFGGEGHFLWQPALVGRLAIAVMSAMGLLPQQARTYWPALAPAEPVLARSMLLTGDIRQAKPVGEIGSWREAVAPRQAEALLIEPPASQLAGLTKTPEPRYSALAYLPDYPDVRPVAMLTLQPISDLLYGARPGGMGETCAVVILVAGLYLVYRNYVKWQLPVYFLLSAAVVAAVGPVQFARPNGSVETAWWPIAVEGWDVGFLYVIYQILGGGVVLAAFFLATEMTSRPVTTGGQIAFGLGGGTLAMTLQLYVDTTIPAYMAVLAMNTFTPVLDGLFRPRVLGQRRFERFRRWWPRRGADGATRPAA